MPLMGWMGDGDFLPQHGWYPLILCEDVKDKWWLEMMGSMGTLWAGLQHCVKAALPSPLS